jgi:hypothetical protein
MNEKISVLPEKIRGEIDFDYIDELGEQERRAATFYEYARHSVPLKEFVKELKEAGAFKSGLSLPLEMQEKVNSKLNVLSIIQLWGLVVNDGFPSEPYQHSKKGDANFPSDSNYYGIEAMARIPWSTIMEGVWQRRNKEEQLDYLREQNGSSTLHAISIPWKHTNRELMTMFRDILLKARPDNFPEPKKGGRKGRSAKLPVKDLLNQLAAYRLYQAKCDFYEGGLKYQSEKGWKKAIRMAEKRIESIMERPFFDRIAG